MKKTRVGQDLITGMSEAISHAKGERQLRTSTFEIPDPAKRWESDQIASLRKRKFKVSQPVFAAILSVKVSTIRAWEQGLKSPSGAACRLLEIADTSPEAFQKLAH